MTPPVPGTGRYQLRTSLYIRQRASGYVPPEDRVTRGKMLSHLEDTHFRHHASGPQVASSSFWHKGHGMHPKALDKRHSELLSGL